MQNHRDKSIMEKTLMGLYQLLVYKLHLIGVCNKISQEVHMLFNAI